MRKGWECIWEIKMKGFTDVLEVTGEGMRNQRWHLRFDLVIMMDSGVISREVRSLRNLSGLIILFWPCEV